MRLLNKLFPLVILGIFAYSGFLIKDGDSTGLEIDSLEKLAFAIDGEFSENEKKGNYGQHDVSWTGTAYKVEIKTGVDAGKTKWVFNVDPSIHIQLSFVHKTVNVNKYCDMCNKENSDRSCITSELCKVTDAELNMLL